MCKTSQSFVERSRLGSPGATAAPRGQPLAPWPRASAAPRPRAPTAPTAPPPPLHRHPSRDSRPESIQRLKVLLISNRIRTMAWLQTWREAGRELHPRLERTNVDHIRPLPDRRADRRLRWDAVRVVVVVDAARGFGEEDCAVAAGGRAAVPRDHLPQPLPTTHKHTAPSKLLKRPSG